MADKKPNPLESIVIRFMAKALEDLQEAASKEMAQDQFNLYLRFWEFLALNSPWHLGKAKRPSEIKVIDGSGSMPEVFADFIGTLDI